MVTQIENAQAKIQASIDKIEQSYAGLGAYADAAMGGDKSSFTSFERRVISIQSAIDTLQENIRQLGEAGIPQDVLEPYRQSIEATRGALGELTNDVRTAYNAASQAPSPTGLKETESGANKASSALRGMFTSHKASGGLESALKKISSGLKDLSKNASTAGGKLFRNLLRYGFGIRSMYVLFRRLRKAVTESFGELQNSGAFFETTRANVEALKNSLSTLKFQFGAAFEPIFNAVAPALETLVNYLITVMNVISAFMAKLTGKSTYSKVSAVFGKTASGAGGAAKAVKELNKQLQGFDELNNLTQDQQSGGGGGGGGGAGSGGAEYEEASVESVLGDFGTKLADMIRAGNWEGVGAAISEKISEQLEKIDWNKNKAKAAKFGTNLANFLNGLINPRLFKNIGMTIGESINTGLTFFNSWGEGMNWPNVGTSLGTGFNAWVQTGNLGLLGETLHTWIAGGLDAANAFFETADFEELGKQLAEFIGKLDIPDLVNKLGTLALNLITALGDAIKGLWNNASAKDKLIMGIVGVLSVLKFTGLLGGLAGNIGTALGGTPINIPTLTLAIGEFLIVGELANQLVQWIQKQLGIEPNGMSFGEEMLDIAEGATTGNLAPAIAMMVGDMLGALPKAEPQEKAGFYNSATRAIWAMAPEALEKAGDFIKSLPTKAADFMVGMTQELSSKENQDFLKGYFGYGAGYGWRQFADKYNLGLGSGLGSIAGEVQAKGTSESDAFAKEKELLDDYLNFKWFKKDLDILFAPEDGGTSMLNAWKKVDKKLTATNAIYKGLAKTNKQFGNESVKTSNQFVKGFNGMPSKIQGLFKDSYNKSTNVWSSIGDWAKEKDKTISSAFDNTAKNVSNDFGKAYKDSTGKWSEFGLWTKDKVTTINTGFNDTPEAVSTDFGKAYTQSTSKWAQAGAWAKNKSKETSSGFNGMPSALASTFGTAYSDSKAKWNDAPTWAKNTSTKVSSGFNGMPSGVASKFQTAYTSSQNKWANIGTWANNTMQKVVTASSNKMNQVPGIYKNSFDSASKGATASINAFKTWYDKVGFAEKELKVAVAKPGVDAAMATINALNSYWTDKTATYTVKADGLDQIQQKVANIAQDIARMASQSAALEITRASYIGNGAPSNVQQYMNRKSAAGGVVSGGQWRFVGESGDEAILPLTDNTLGRLSSMIVGEMASPSMPVMAQNSYNGYSTSGASASDIAEQNRLLAEQNQLLRVIADKELTVSTREVFEATRKESNNYYNRTGESPFFY
jgi:hypothetical protein